MAVTLVFGLGLATLFVLFLVPAYLGVGHDIRKGLRGLADFLLARQRAQPAE